MPSPRFLRVLCLLLGLLTATGARAAYELVQAPLPDDPMKTHIFQLENGLKVYLTENHETPRFYAEIAVRAGSKMDPAESTGLAHYLEHLLFKGTSKYGTLDYTKEKEHLDKITDLYQQHFFETDPQKREELYEQINQESVAASAFAVPNEMDRLYQAMGGSELNAHTSNEETVYKVELPANRLEQWAVLEAERFREPVFRLFQTELETVYEEMNRSLDNKDRIISYAVEKQLYKKHPYGQQPTIGLPEQLKNPSLKNIGDFYSTWYVPNNMSIFISGDINIDAAIALIDRNFSEWQRKDIPEPKTWDEAPLDKREEVVVTYQGEEFVLLAFRTASQNSDDAEALQLLDMILDNANAGLINLNLNQQQRVRQAGAYPQQYNDYGGEYLYGIPKEGQTLEEVEKLLLEQLDILKRGEFEDWLIPAIITDYKKTRKAGLESDQARVSMMRESWLAFQTWEHAVQKIDRMEKLTKDDVVRVANKYFGSGYIAGFRKDAPHVVPDMKKPALAKIDIDPTRQSEFAMALIAMPVKPIEPEFITPGKDYSVDKDEHGITFYYVPNPVNDIFTLSLTVEMGTQQDPTIATAAALLDKSGTERLSAEELQKEWYKLGTDFGLGSGDNETSISLSGLDENFEASVKLLRELLRTPDATEETLAELKKIILVEREDMKKQLNGIASGLVQYNRYGQDSAFLRQLPSDRLMAATEEELLGVIKKLLSHKHVISYAGSLPKERVQEILAQNDPVTDTLLDPAPYHYLKARRPEATEIYFHPKEAAQASVRIEFGTMEYTPELEPSIQLYNEYFAGGMAGIVFQELREARALAYSAGARYIPGYRKNDEDLMIGAIQSQADKTTDALQAFIELFDKMPQSNERFLLAREALLSSYRTSKINFRGIADAVRGWERRGLDPDPRKAWFEQVQSASMEDVLKFYNEIIAGEPKLISVVGDPAKIDMEKLKTIAPVKEIPLDEMFVK